MPPLFGSDRFKLEAKLGSGGFGDVYRVYDRERSASVALKVVRQLTPETLFRFKREFRSLADLSHPNLIKLHELHNVDDQWFFTMELVDGVPFTEHVRSGSSLFVADSASHDLEADAASTVAVSELPTESRLATLRSQRMQFDIDPKRLRVALLQLVEGLAALHQNGLLHRDLKPSNVLVDKDGRVVILDFGLVTETVAGSVMATREIVGTPAYMSPEHVSNGLVVPASDWYALGVMLFEAIANRPVFESRGLDLLTEKTLRDAPSLSELVDGVPDDLEALCSRLLDRDHSRRAGADAITKILSPSAPPAAPAPSADHALVEREPHLALLSQAFRDLEDGRPIVALVHGQPGVGKSALVRHFLQELRAHHGDQAVILAGRCYEQEAVRYKALDSLVDALCRYLRRLPESVVEALLPLDAWALALAFPVLNRVTAVKRAPRRVKEMPEPQELRRRAAGALRELFARLSDRRRLVLFVDDLQWGDVDSAAIIHDVLRPPDAPAVLWIASYRREERDRSRALREFLNGQNRADGVDVRSIAVDELTPAGARELARGQLPADVSDVAETIGLESSGSPLFVKELVNYVATHPLRAGEKLSLANIIRARTADLSPAARRALEVIAIAGQPVDHEVVRNVALESGETRPVDELLRQYFVRETHADDRPLLETSHDRIREAIVEALPAAEQELLHGKLAVELERARASIDPERLALHFLRGGDADKAIEYSLAAGDAAVRALAFDRASELYRRALALLGPADRRRGPLQVSLADALASAGRSSEAGEEYVAALEHVTSSDQLELRRRAAEQLLRGGRVDDGIAQLQRVSAAIGLSLASNSTLAVARLLLMRARLAVRGFGFVEKRASEIAPDTLLRIDACWTASVGLSMVDTIQGVEFQARNMLLSLQAGEPLRIARALAIEVAHGGIPGVGAADHVKRMLSLADEVAARVKVREAQARVTVMSAVASWLMGDWPASYERASRGEKILREECTGVQWELGTAQIMVAASLTWMGELALLREQLPRFSREARARGDLYTEASLTLMVYAHMLELANDQPEAARKQIQFYLGRWSSRGYHQQHLWAAYGQAEIYLYEQQPGLALDVVKTNWGSAKKVMLLRPQAIFIIFCHLRGRCAVAGAMRASGNLRKALLTEARAAAHSIEKTKAEWASPMTDAIRAGIAAVEGRPEASVELLRKAEQGFVARHTALYAAAARIMLARLDPAFSANGSSAAEWMKGQGIQIPDRIADVLIPGFSSVD